MAAVRVLLLVLLFVVWESGADAPAPRVPLDTGAMGLAIGYCLLVGGLGLWARRVAGMTAGSYLEMGRRVDRFNVGMAVARVAVPAWFAVGVFALGWRVTVEHALRRTVGQVAVWPLVTPGVVVGLLPGFLGWAGLWWSQYPVDRAVREQGVLAQLEADLPVFAPPPFAGYFANKLRAQLLFTTVPVLLILALRDAATAAVAAAARPGWVRWPPSDAVDSAAYVGSVAVVVLLVPAVLRHVLHTQRLPDSRLRDALSTVLRLAGVRCREVLLWHTHNNLSNAAVMGLVPAVRYVLLSDLLVESMTDEQVQAVFAHELGHVRHRHLAWLVGVLGSGMAALSVGCDWALSKLVVSSNAAAVAWQAASVTGLVAVTWVGYGLLSRWFERQADVFAARVMDRATGAGAATFAAALHRVAVVNDIPYAARNWTHGSIASRVDYIGRLAADPAVGRRFDRAGRWVHAALAVLVVASTAVAVVGFRHEATTVPHADVRP